MNTLVNDNGFIDDDWTVGFIDLEHLKRSDTGGHAIHLASDTDIADVAPFLGQLALIRIDFPSFADGRGFSLAKRLRLLGYRGRLRARGHILADQYRNVRRSGFDEVEIDANLAGRQPETQWLSFNNWTKYDYQERLRPSV